MVGRRPAVVRAPDAVRHHVLEPTGDRNRMRRVAHRADGPEVVRGGLQERLGGLRAVRLVGGAEQFTAPVLQVADQFWRLFPEFPVALVVPSPVVPHRHVPAGPMRIEPVRPVGKQDVRHLVRVPRRHLHLVGHGPFGLQAPLDGLEAQVDANFAPIVPHQFQADPLGRLEIYELEGDDQRRPVRVFAQAVAVDVQQAEFVQQRAGVVRIVANMRLGEAFLVPAARRVHRHLARRSTAEVDDLVHLIAVDRVGERADEAPLALAPYQVPVLEVVVVVVRLYGHVGDVQPAPDVHLVDALPLAELEQGYVRRIKRVADEVELAGGGLERDHLRVLEHDDHIHRVDVRQLVARGIYFEVVGVAFQAQLGGRALHRPERAQGGYARGVLVAPSAQLVEHGHPADVTLLLHQRVEFVPVPVRRVIVLQEVHRIDEVAAEEGEVVGEHRVRLREDVLEGQVIDRDELRSAHGDVRQRLHFRVQPVVVEPEHEVVGGQRRAVGPLDPGTQADRRDAAVFAHAPGLRQVGQDVAQVRGNGQRVLPGEELPPVPKRDARLAAVLADTLVGVADEGVVRQAIRHRRKVPAVQDRALRELRDAEFARGLRRGEPLRRHICCEGCPRWRYVHFGDADCRAHCKADPHTGKTRPHRAMMATALPPRQHAQSAPASQSDDVARHEMDFVTAPLVSRRCTRWLDGRPWSSGCPRPRYRSAPRS